MLVQKTEELKYWSRAINNVWIAHITNFNGTCIVHFDMFTDMHGVYAQKFHQIS